MKPIVRFVGIAFSALLLWSCGEQTPPAEENGTPETASQVIQQPPEPILNGAKQEYYPSGELMAEGFMKDGLRHGLWTGYGKTGNLKSRVEYVNGEQQGAAIVYYENGGVYYTGDYKDDKKIGIWRFYDTAGKLIKTEDFDAR